MRLRPSISARPIVSATLIFCCGTASAVNVHRSLVTNVPPLYPEIALRMRVAGIVTIHIVIQPDGTVSATRIASGHALLTSAAQTAVRHWRYSPSTEVSETDVQISFNLAGR